MAGAMLLAAAEEARLRSRETIRRRLLRDASQPLMTSEKEFIGHYRLQKADFERLCEEIIPLLPSRQRTSAVRPEIRVLAALAFYANGCYQKNVGAYYHLGLAQSTVSECLRDVTDALNHPSIQTKYIKFPNNRTEREDIASKFMDAYGFHGVVGCVDGTHIAIIRPSDQEEAYYNRKHYHSLNVLLICDAELRILHVDASFGGQSHDSHVWNSSPVKALIEDLHEHDGEIWWLLGDSGYAQRPWMMTPILNAAPNSPEEYYTSKHTSTRNVVERCIGVLKSRWRCLLAHRVMHYDPVKAGKIVNACVILHNFISNTHVTISAEEMMRDSLLQPSQELPVRDQLQQRYIDEGRHAVVERLWRNRNIN